MSVANIISCSIIKCHICYPHMRILATGLAILACIFVGISRRATFKMDRRSAAFGLLNFITATSLLLLVFVNATAEKARRTPADLLQADGVPVQTFIAHGTLWHTYIDAFAYHLLNDSSARNAGVSRSHFSLMDLIQTLVTLALGKQNPCRHMTFNGNYSDNDQYHRVTLMFAQTMEQFLANWYSWMYFLRIKSSICGSISSNIMSQSMTYSWAIHVHTHFKVNVTITSFKVNYFLGCDELYVVIFDAARRNDINAIGHHCPNSAPRSFYTAYTITQLSVYSIRDYLSALDAPRADLAHLEFQYQVLDKNFKLVLEGASLDALTPNPVFEQRRVVVHSGGFSYQPAIFFRMAMAPADDTPNMSITSKHLNESTAGCFSSNHTFDPPLPTAHLMESWIFDSFHLRMIYIQAPLGMSVSVSSGTLLCQTEEEKVVFYDGPPFDILHADNMLERLAEWHCQVLTNLSLFHLASTKHQEKFHASIGEITLIIMWNSSFNLNFNMGFLVTDQIRHQNLNVSFTKTITVHPVTNTPSVHVLNIRSLRFIQVTFERLSYEGYFDKLCQVGGIFIFSDFKHVGSICSQLIAKLMVNHYHKQGMRLGAYVQIVVKQYTKLSRIMATFHFSTSKCIGYVNLLANMLFGAHAYSPITGALVRRYPVYYDFPLAMDVKYKTPFWKSR